MAIGGIEIVPLTINVEPSGSLGTIGPIEYTLVGGLPTILMDGLGVFRFARLSIRTWRSRRIKGVIEGCVDDTIDSFGFVPCSL